MFSVSNFLKDKFSNERTFRASKNVLVAMICRVLMTLISFIVIPLTLNYVGSTEYGIWISISSIISWFGFFDIGLGNGLRNKLAESIALGNHNLGRIYVSSVYAIIFVVSLTLFILFWISSQFIPWDRVLNTTAISRNGLMEVINMVFFFFCIAFVLKLLSSVLMALQSNWLNEIIGLLSQVLGLIGIYILVNHSNGSLYNLCLVYSLQNVIVLLLSSFILFNWKLRDFRPRLLYVDIKAALPLVNLGAMFLINQLLYIFVTQAPVFIIIQWFGPEEVSIYNLSYKYMYSFSMIYIMILTPFLTAFTEAYYKKDFEWIKSTMKKINIIWLFGLFSTSILIFFNNFFFNLWLDGAISAPLILLIFMGISSFIETKSSTYSLFLNGVGALKIQSILLVAQAILIVPISYLLYKFEFGLLSITLCQILFGIITYIVYFKRYKFIISQY